MTKEQVNKLLSEGEFAGTGDAPELIETHISWIIMSDPFVYKIKKPVCYSFLDFSTPAKRKFYCEREIVLNRRLSDDIYLDIHPIKQQSGRLFIGAGKGDIIDYAVRMRRLDGDLRMDTLLSNNKVTAADISRLAEKIAAFHKKADIVYQKDLMKLREEFNNLAKEKDYLQQNQEADSYAAIGRAIDVSDVFLQDNRQLLTARLAAGLFRDGHGDLHSRNIFLLPSPQPFDCIEFNNDYRQIDVLNDIAFLCMDLDAFGRQDLSALFLTRYNDLFPAIRTGEDRKLFIYYKCYRANIRAKINSLRARSAGNAPERKLPLAEAEKYLKLMDRYLDELTADHPIKITACID